MAVYGDLSNKNRYGRQYGAMSFGDLSNRNRYGSAYSSTPVKAPSAPRATTPGSSPPVSPSGAVLPLDPAYDQQIGALQRQRDTSVSGLQSQRAATLLGYGYNEGAGGALTFDPNNAFSKAAQLKKRFDESRAGTGNQMASRGQLYAGAYQTAQDTLNRNQLQGEDSLQKQVLAYLAANTGQQEQARTGYQFGEAQAGADRLARLADNPLYNPGASAGASASPAAAASAPTVSPKAAQAAATKAAAAGLAKRNRKTGLKLSRI